MKPLNELWDKLTAQLRTARERIADLETELATLKSRPPQTVTWHKISEGLPGIGRYYLVSATDQYGDPFIMEAFLSRDGWRLNGNADKDKVTHWAALPALPEGE